MFSPKIEMIQGLPRSTGEGGAGGAGGALVTWYIGDAGRLYWELPKRHNKTTSDVDHHSSLLNLSGSNTIELVPTSL